MVAVASRSVCLTIATGLATVPVGSMARTVASRLVGLALSVSITAGAPVSTSARVSQLRSPTTSAFAAKTVRATATLTTVTTLRRVGRRSSPKAVRAGPIRPRRRFARPLAAATGTARREATSPAASATRVGVTRASGPSSEPVASPISPNAASATARMSTIPKARARSLDTRRSRAETVSFWTGRAASQIATTHTTAEAASATTEDQGTSNGTPSGSRNHRTSVVSSRARPNPRGSPIATVAASSPITIRPAPSRLRPRSLASATSGRRCSTAAWATSRRMAAASSPSWAISNGTMTRSWCWPTLMPSMTVGTWVSTSAPSMPWPVARSLPVAARTLEISCRLPSVNRSRRSGKVRDACATLQSLVKVSSTVTKSSIAGTCSVPTSTCVPDLPSSWVRCQYASSGTTS